MKHKNYFNRLFMKRFSLVLMSLLFTVSLVMPAQAVEVKLLAEKAIEFCCN